ncbi:MAG TPA: glycosyltransferase family 4 protein [Xanthobacteraceae bacterium]|nr:glycosyltransferase family 4 protein [Xanthobacteraceae bacterium]
MHEAWFAIPGDLSTPTGGYRYDRRLMEELRALGWDMHRLALPGDFPAPSQASLRETERLLSETPNGAVILFDGLALGALPAGILDRVPRRYVALVHHPLALETGISRERAKALAESERAALRRVRHVVVTSRPTAELLVADFGVAPDQITVAEPGTESAPRARGGETMRLLGVGSVTPRKGFDTLVAALSKLADLEWECRIAGSLDRDPEAAENLKKQIASADLQERVRLLGSLSDEALNDEYDRAMLFVLPSHFEGYGMAFTEALARGLPIVACEGGAVTTTVPADAGVFVRAGDADALASTLRWLIENPGEIKKRAGAAWKAAQSLPRWPQAASKIAGVLERVAI